MAEENKVQAVAAKNEGNEFYKRKDFVNAISCYEKASELDPTDMTYLNNKAAVFFEQGKFEECVKQCESAAEVGRENRNDFKLIAKAYARMASAYVKMNDLPNARTYFQKSLTEHRTPETLTKLSEVEKQIKEQERMAYLDPEMALEEKTKGNERFQKGDYPSAIKHYTEAIKRNPDDSKVFSNRAACYQKLTEFPLALKDSEECIRLDPTFIKGYIRKGLALTAMKELSKAQVAYQKALEIDEHNQEAIDGYRKCMSATSGNPEEIRKRAMNDPEIQKILTDPAMRLILEQMQTDPKALQEHFKNPAIAEKMMKLMECGIVRMGPE